MNFAFNKKGFTLTEVLLSIAVIVIIGILAYPIYKNAREDAEVEQIINDMAMLQSATMKTFAGQAIPDEYSTICSGYNLMNLLNSEGNVPASLVSDNPDTPYIGPWGGEIYVGCSFAEDGATGMEKGFQFYVTLIPSGLCNRLINRVAPMFSSILTEAGRTYIKKYPEETVDTSQIPVLCANNGYVGHPDSFVFGFGP